MISKMFTVYDSKAEVYTPIFMHGTLGEAIRMFSDTLKDSSHPMSKHPEDYSLFHIGEYDNLKASCVMLPTPVSLGVGLEFLKNE